MNSNNENNRQHFASFMEEARYLMGKLKSDVCSSDIWKRRVILWGN